jgi:uncharacterized glyoxalase superfamily protein PhnB
MFKAAVPVFHISNSAEALKFYCEKLGFRHEFSHRAIEAQADPCYSGVSRDGIWLHLSSFSGDAVVGGVANIIVENVEPVNQTWGSREMYVKDSDGNCLRFQQL